MLTLPTSNLEITQKSRRVLRKHTWLKNSRDDFGYHYVWNRRRSFMASINLLVATTSRAGARVGYNDTSNPWKVLWFFPCPFFIFVPPSHFVVAEKITVLRRDCDLASRTTICDDRLSSVSFLFFWMCHSFSFWPFLGPEEVVTGDVTRVDCYVCSGILPEAMGFEFFLTTQDWQQLP